MSNNQEHAQKGNDDAKKVEVVLSPNALPNFDRNLSIEIPQIKATTFWERCIKLHFIYSLAGLLFGFACIAFGTWLFYKGIDGNIDWSTSILGAESRIVNCAPGALLFIVGMLIAWSTRFQVSIKKNEK